MQTVKNALSRTKTFVADHRVAIAVATTAVVTTVVVKKTVGNMHESAIEFLREKNLLDEYYATLDDLTDNN